MSGPKHPIRLILWRLPSYFTKEAKEYASLIESKIILIDGEQLSNLMAEHRVGASTVGMYEVEKLDSDYSDEE